MSTKNNNLSTLDSTWISDALPQREAVGSGSKDGGSVAPSLSGVNILLTDEHYKHSLGIVRHLGRVGAHVSIIATSKESLACRSRFCHQVILSDGPTVGALVGSTLRAIKQMHFDLVMPVSYPMTLALARRRDEVVAYTHLELAKTSAIERAADKARMMELARKIGVPVPKSFLVTELRDRGGELRYPVVVKPQKESPGRGPILYLQNSGELRDFLSAESESKLCCEN